MRRPSPTTLILLGVIAGFAIASACGNGETDAHAQEPCECVISEPLQVEVVAYTAAPLPVEIASSETAPLPVKICNGDSDNGACVRVLTSYGYSSLAVDTR